MEGCWKICFYSPFQHAAHRQGAYLSLLPMIGSAMPGTKARLNFVPVNSLVMLAPGGMFLV